MRLFKTLGVAALIVAWSTLAIAQSNPGLTKGQVLTAGQWNALFAGKQDYLGAPPVLTTGGTMTGPLVTSPSTASSAGFTISPGVAPTSPFNGNLWITPGGLFAQLNGTTVPIAGAAVLKPFVILATGQSNFVLTPTFSWSPNPNAVLWNSNGGTGTAYTAIPNSTVNITWKIASDIADANPTRQVCLINISFSGQSISHWLPTTPPVDVYQSIQNNITAGLAACGATKIDLFEWWQGEGDTGVGGNGPVNPNYIANFKTMMDRFWADTTPGFLWFPQETPVVIHGVEYTALSGFSGQDQINDLLQGVVNVDTDKRRFVYTSALKGPVYWDAGNPGHMTGQGYFDAGAMSANAFLNGPGRNTLPSTIVSPFSLNQIIGLPGISPTSPLTVNANTNINLPPVISGTPPIIDLVGADGAGAYAVLESFGAFSDFICRRANGTSAAKTKLLSGDLICGVGAHGYDAVGEVVGDKAGWYLYANEDWNDATHHGTKGELWLTQLATNTTGVAYRFTPGCFATFGTTSGSLSQCAPAAAGSNTITWPAGTTNFTATGGTSQVIKQTSVGGAFTVGQLAFSDLAAGTSTCAQEPALTGDITSLSGSCATTLQTVATAGTTGSSTAIPVITINVKGLTTSITTAAVIAPAGTLSGTTLNSTVTASSLTSLGTIASLTATQINAFTLAGTISGGGNQINNVIIGTTTPLAGLFTTVSASTSLTTPLRLGGSAAGSTAEIRSTSGTGSGDSVFITGGTNGATRIATFLGTGLSGFGSAAGAAVPTNTTVVISRNATTVDAAQGTLTNLLHLVGNTGEQTSMELDSFGSLPGISFRAAGTSASAKTAVTALSFLGSFFASGWDGTTYGFGAELIFKAGETFDATHHGTFTSLFGVASGSTTLTEYIRVQMSGGVSIGNVTVDPGAGVVAANGFVSYTAAKTLVLKQGANGAVGTFVCTGGGTITISNTNIAITDAITISLNTLGGTITTPPATKAITASTSFQVLCGATDTSTYNYALIKNAP